MKTIILLLLSIIGWDGWYFPPLDYIACDEPLVCKHEEGHRLDYKLGLPSQTQEFKDAIDSEWPIFLESTSCKIETEECLYSEAYARLWSITDVDRMEEHFEGFIKFYE